MNYPTSIPCFRAPLAAALFWLAAISGSAAVLAEYQFVDSTGNPTNQAVDVTGSAASWSFSGGTIGFGGSSQSAYAQASALPTSFDTNKYLTFTLTAASGKVLNLSSFSFDLGGNASGTGVNVTLTAEVRADTESTLFNTPLVVTPPSGTSASHVIPGNDPALAYTHYVIDLSGAEFQGRESITFRLYVATSHQLASRFLRYDNLSIEGSAVSASSIPEPASAAVVTGVIALGLIGSRRRFGK